MPLRMLGFILALVVLVTFVGLNWDNSSNIDLWFNQQLHFEDVSIVLSFLIVFLAGMLSSIPFWLDSMMKRKKRDQKKHAVIKSAPPVVKKEKVTIVDIPENESTKD